MLKRQLGWCSKATKASIINIMRTDKTNFSIFDPMKQTQATDQQFFQIYKNLPLEKKKKVVAYVEKLSDFPITPPAEKKAKFGSAKGLFTIKPGFDDPLEDFKEYM